MPADDGLALHAEDLVDPPGSERTFAVLEGGRRGTRIVQRTSATDDDGARTVEDRVVVDPTPHAPGREIPSERLHLDVRDGGFALRAVETPEEDSTSVFDRGLVFAPHELVAGDAAEDSSRMTVVRTSDGSARAKGGSTRTMRLRGRAEVEASGERLEVAVVEVTFAAELDAATVRRTSEIFVAPGRGVIAERWRERLVVLGLFPRTSGETAVLVGAKRGRGEAPRPRPEAAAPPNP